MEDGPRNIGWTARKPESSRGSLEDDVTGSVGNDAHGYRMKARSADTLHVAILEQINPDLFVTGDKDQQSLAIARGFQTACFV